MTPEEVLRAFGEALRELRERRGYSQSEMGLDRSHIHRMELGESDPKLTTLAQLARALHISLPHFVEEINRRRRVPDPEAESEEWMLDGILLMVRSGHMDNAKNRQWLLELYAIAKARGAYRILLDLSHLICDFNKEEAYEGARSVEGVFEELDYKPTAVAVVYNPTIPLFGAKVARDHGLNVAMFLDREEALAWLQLQPNAP